MKQTFIAALVVLAFVGNAQAVDKDGNYSIVATISCGEYLDAYSKTTLTGTKTFNGSHEAWIAFGYISGMITAYNAYVPNGKPHILGRMSNNDARRWIASWRRDNPSKGIHNAVMTLINKLEK